MLKLTDVGNNVLIINIITIDSLEINSNYHINNLHINLYQLKPPTFNHQIVAFLILVPYINEESIFSTQKHTLPYIFNPFEFTANCLQKKKKIE